MCVCLQSEDLELLLARRGHPTLSHDEPLDRALVERLTKAFSDEFCRFEWESGHVPNFHAGAPQLCSLNCLSSVSRGQVLPEHHVSCQLCLALELQSLHFLLERLEHAGVLLPCTVQSCRESALCLRSGCYLRALVQTLTAAAPAAVMETAGGTMLCWKNSILVCGGMDSGRKEHNNVWKWDLGGDTGFNLCHTTGYACCMTPVSVEAVIALRGFNRTSNVSVWVLLLLLLQHNPELGLVAWQECMWKG